MILHVPAATVTDFVPTAIVEELGPDRCRLVSGSWSWVALAAALGRFDTDMEVVGPDELRAACELLARRYSAAAGGGGSRQRLAQGADR
ncbi:hypothetical protein [Nocardia inohanensis]|uniref:hypothetical protein n=1 Tax=Nocardia inohanensis TaxID=209246 RepID=UPI00082C40BF|nr:hypothetical protein [Nocardia inohanensis]